MRAWCLALAALLLASCSSSSSGGQPDSCSSRCVAHATTCQNDTSQCGTVCGWITEAQLSCLEHSGCDSAKVAACVPTGSGGAGGASGSGSASQNGGASTASGGSGSMCLGIGTTGCTTAASGPSCCAPGTCDEAKGVCCVNNPNTPCKKDADCCGANAQCVATASGAKVCGALQ